jgi:SAM-dependent methyltransferase
MGDKHDLISKWSAEYARGGIPSSIRETPSGAVVWAVEELKRQGFPLRETLDLGCGKGRNSLYLAEQGAHVTAMDFTPNAIEHLQTVAAERGLTKQIRALVQDVTEDWPIAPGSMDLIVDAFCFKHIAPHAARRVYRTNMLRALRLHGHYLISFASIGDGYYGHYAAENGNEGEQLAVDPVVGVESVLYTRDAVAQFFAPDLLPLAELQNNKPSLMDNKEHQAYALLMQRNPHHYPV